MVAPEHDDRVLAQAQAIQFIEDLADLVENRAPRALEARLERDDAGVEKDSAFKSSFAVGPDQAWDVAAAEKRVRAATGAEDGPNAKYASAFYGPFRDAVGSARKAGEAAISKASYQMNPANRREALREAALDAAEGADLLMVKPAGAYLDIIRDLREATPTPIAAYQVSGEYAQLHAAAAQGWLDLRATRDESLLAIRRAGANVILSYFAEAYARDFAAKPLKPHWFFSSSNAFSASPRSR